MPLAEIFLTTGFDILDLNDTEISLFAPSVELSQEDLGNKELVAVLGTHVVNRTIFAALLEDGSKLETLSEGLFLQISQIKEGNKEVRMLAHNTWNYCYVQVYTVHLGLHASV